MGRSPSNSSREEMVKKGPWTPEEDDKLIKFIEKNGHGSWRALPNLAGLNRCGKSCRLRWTNYLRPDIKRGKFSQNEEQTILNLHAILGNKWSTIATHLPGRTDNEIKNFWNTHLKKKLIQMGFDPMTHRPRTDLFAALPQLVALANLIDVPPIWPDSDALQIARLNHLLQSILPPTSPTSSFPNLNMATSNFGMGMGCTDMVATMTALGLDQQISSNAEFSQLPALQASDDKDGYCTPVMCHYGSAASSGDNNMTWMEKNVAMESLPPSVVTPGVETSGSTASYIGDQIWADLLDDPIFHDIA